MFSAFLMGPAASGSGLCDIDRVMFRVITSRVEKNGKSWDGENIPSIMLLVIGLFLSCKDYPIF